MKNNTLFDNSTRTGRTGKGSYHAFKSDWRYLLALLRAGGDTYWELKVIRRDRAGNTGPPPAETEWLGSTTAWKAGRTERELSSFCVLIREALGRNALHQDQATRILWLEIGQRTHGKGKWIVGNHRCPLVAHSTGSLNLSLQGFGGLGEWIVRENSVCAG